MIGVGIIGTGKIAMHHVRGYLSIPKEAKITAICDIDEEKGNKFAKEINVRSFYKNYQDLLERKDIKIVSICTPAFNHVLLCMDALKAGKSVLCEKPIAGSLKEIDKIIKAQKRYGGIINSVFQWRYGRGLKMLQKFMSEGLTGKFLWGGVEILWRRTMDYYNLAPWRGTWKGEKGGALVTLAIHAIDAFISVTPSVESVSSYVETMNHDIEVDDTSVTSIRFKGGALGQIIATSNNQQNTSKLKFIFKNLLVVSNDKPYATTAWPWYFKSADPELQIEIDRRIAEFKDDELKGHTVQIMEFVKNVSKGKVPPVTLTEARKSLELIAAIYKSGFSEKRVFLPIKKNDPHYQSFEGKR